MIIAVSHFIKFGKFLYRLWLRFVVVAFHLVTIALVFLSAVALYNWRTVSLRDVWPVWIAAGSFLGVIYGIVAVKEHLISRTIPLNGKGLGLNKNQENL